MERKSIHTVWGGSKCQCMLGQCCLVAPHSAVRPGQAQAASQPTRAELIPIDCVAVKEESPLADLAQHAAAGQRSGQSGALHAECLAVEA